MMIYLSRTLIVIVLHLLTSHVAWATNDLVSTQWLKKNLLNIKLVDVRPPEDYAQGHIKNAINLPLTNITRSKNGVQGYVETPLAFKKQADKLGIKNSDILVFYSDWSFLNAMRAYWIFDFYGHNNIKVLNGGIQAWQQAQLALTQTPPSITPSNFILQIRPDIIATKFNTFMATKSDDYIIVDARDSKQYNGIYALNNKKGHILGAINLPWFTLVDNRKAKDGYQHLDKPSLLSNLSTLKQKLEQIPKNKKIILYCNGGQEASVLYFSLKAIGRQAAIYDGSWLEWSADNKMPIEQASHD